MDEIAKYNVERWRRLVEAKALYTRPLLNLDTASARDRVDPRGWLGEIEGRRILCLAGGGGRESAAFTLLGAHVTVFDLSEEQLEQDRRAAAHYGFEVETVQGDMRDLSQLHGMDFDIVLHSYSLNFVPDARTVFGEVARVVRPGGLYRFMCANPFVMGVGTRDWDGQGYALAEAYIDGAEVTGTDEEWVYERAGREAIRPPREYRHGLGTLVGGLSEQGFRIVRASEDESIHPVANAVPGTWDHFVSIIRPWLTFLSRYDPDASAV
jgi:2-polyprenyl-3-methyl-5-hydroxy-6-metoxy-1,4-benzoquinol methylase